MRPLPRPALPHSSWLSPLLAAGAMWAILAAVADQPIATQRSLVFLCGPLLLLSGLHARLFGFLHAPDRARDLPLPIAPELHFRSAIAAHRSRFWLTGVFGIAAVGLAGGFGLAAEFAWLVVIAATIEPFVAGISAEYGRRFPASSPAHELQRSLGGGWTTPEAVVHLYAPAFGIGLAVLLAMPGQLSWERWLDSGEVRVGQIAIGIAPLAIGLGLRLGSAWLFRRGMWEAVPWLTEATRTLAGPPQPEPTPTWAARIGDPWTRLLVIQFWRISPLPGLRLALVLLIPVVALIRSSPPSAPMLAVGVATIGIWLVPLGQLARDRLARGRLAGALPLPPSHRGGRAGAIAVLAVMAPVLLSCVTLGYRVARDGLIQVDPVDTE